MENEKGETKIIIKKIDKQLAKRSDRIKLRNI